MTRFQQIAQAIAANFFGFDFIIFIAAAANAVLAAFAMKEAARLRAKLHLEIFAPEGVRARERAVKEFDELSAPVLAAMRTRAQRLYSLFVNITGIFPLLGILGTVVSLIPMVDGLVSLEANFFAALTSTFWGIVFAIIFKLADGFIGARMEENEKDLALWFDTTEKRKDA